MNQWRTPILMQFGPTEGCGCPMEEWFYCGIVLTMHFEPDGRVDVYADGGDQTADLSFESRQAAFDWVYGLPDEGELAA